MAKEETPAAPGLSRRRFGQLVGGGTAAVAAGALLGAEPAQALVPRAHGPASSPDPGENVGSEGAVGYRDVHGGLARPVGPYSAFVALAALGGVRADGGGVPDRKSVG